MKLKLKRVYDPPASDDGTRVLVDRLWPRGLSKEKAKVEEWPKDVAPSDSLRKWFGHDPERWNEFEKRYFKELDEKPDVRKTVIPSSKKGAVTLVYGAKDEEHNNAVALKDYLEKSHAKKSR